MAKKGIVQSAVILSVAALITRILGFIYRIYISNIIGAEGMGLYQLIMPIYSLAWSLACSGFTTTVSKFVSSEKAKKEYGNMGLILKQSLFITASIGFILSALLFTFSTDIAITFFKDERLTLSLKILSISFPFMATGSCIRGYFFGLQEAKIPAISQVFEQFVRMGVIYFLSFLALERGLEYASAVAVLGITFGEFLSFIYVFYSYKRYKSKNNFIKKPSVSKSKMLRLLFAMAIPLTLNRVVSSLLLTLENIFLPQRLILSGLSQSEAISEFGKISGMAMPLIQFPSAILISLSISLVPAISEASATNNYKKINYTISKTLIFSTITGIGSAGLFVLFSDKLGYVIYNQDIRLLLIYLGVMCPFIYIQMTLSGILNGLSLQMFIFRNSVLSSLISICGVFIFVPKLGIQGYMIGSFISLTTVTLLKLIKIKEVTKIKLNFVQLFLKPTISILSVALAINLLKHRIYEAFGDTLGLIIAFLISGLIYLTFIFLTGTLSKKDIKEFTNK